jgi:hypothetical protein
VFAGCGAAQQEALEGHSRAFRSGQAREMWRPSRCADQDVEAATQRQLVLAVTSEVGTRCHCSAIHLRVGEEARSITLYPHGRWLYDRASHSALVLLHLELSPLSLAALTGAPSPRHLNLHARSGF